MTEIGTKKIGKKLNKKTGQQDLLSSLICKYSLSIINVSTILIGLLKLKCTCPVPKCTSPTEINQPLSTYNKIVICLFESDYQDS